VLWNGDINTKKAKYLLFLFDENSLIITLVNSLTTTKLIGSVLAVVGLLGGCGGQKEAAPPPKAIPVTFQTITTSTVIESSDFVGTLQAVKRVALASQIDGRIDNIYVSDGQKVKAGEKILKLAPYKQEAQVNQAKAQVGQAKADVLQAEAQLETAVSQISKNKSAIAARKADIAQAEAQLQSKEADLQKARSDLKLAQSNYERSKFLVSQGAVAKQDLDDKTSALETAQSALKSAQKQRDASLAALDSSKEALNSAYSDLEISQKQVQEAKANVINKKQGIEAAQGNVGSVRQDLKYNTVVAPINGIVGDISSRKPGDILKNGDTFTSIIDNSTLYLNIYVPVERKGQLKVGLPVEIIKADGTSGNVGRITFISPTVNQDTQVILTKVTFNNNGNLKDSQYVKVRIIWSKKPGILIPTSVVTNIGASNFVFVAEKDKTTEGKEIAKQRLVTLGNIQGQEYKVLSGISPGEQVIVSRTQILSDGVPVVSEAALKNQPKTGS